MEFIKMGYLPETDSTAEMQQIGKEIMSEKSSIYSDKCISNLEKDIRFFLGEQVDENILKETFYETVYNYWAFGCNVSEWFRYGFKGKPFSERKKYYTLRNKFLYLLRLNDKKEVYKLDDKYETYKILMPYYHRNIIEISSESDFPKFEKFVSNGSDILVKPQWGGLGAGIHKIASGRTDKHELFLSLLKEGEAYSKGNKSTISSSIVLEEFIDQDKTMASLHKASVNVVRLTTIRASGKVHYFYPWLKVGMNGAEATGSYQGSSFDVGVDVNTGILNTDGMMKLKVFEKHPNTGITLKGFRIPRWSELLALAKELSDLLPQFGYIGWDFALNSSGEWCVVEANWRGNQEGQWLYGRGLKDEFEDVIGWKPQAKYWWSVL